MNGNAAAVSHLGSRVAQLDRRANVAGRRLDHFPGEICYFGGAEPCLDRQQNNDAISLRVPCRFGEEKEVFDGLMREYFGLLACHQNSNRMMRYSSSFESKRNRKFRAT